MNLLGAAVADAVNRIAFQVQASHIDQEIFISAQQAI